MQPKQRTHLRVPPNVQEYARKCLIVDPRSRIKSADLYHDYLFYATVNNLPPYTRNTFIRMIKRLYPRARLAAHWFDGERARGFAGLALRGSAEPTDEMLLSAVDAAYKIAPDVASDLTKALWHRHLDEATRLIAADERLAPIAPLLRR